MLPRFVLFFAGRLMRCRRFGVRDHSLDVPFHLPSLRQTNPSCNADISWIFDVEGEAGFRVREQNVIKELTTLDNIVLATGGGAILAEENRKHLRRGGTVVYLMATITQQVERTRRDQKRPLLQNTSDPRGKLTALMEIRDPLYREVADYVVMTSRRSPKAVCTEIIQMISNPENSGPSNG